MLTIISSAKTLNFEQLAHSYELTTPIFSNLTNQLLAIIKNYSEKQLASTMDISEKLAVINKERFQNFDNQDSKAAIFAYAGDVFSNIKAEELTEDAVNFLQSHLLIISGLYGSLKPLDAIKPYRLEMATKLKEIKDLSKFWQAKVTDYINKTLDHHKNKFLLNLASQEYSSIINQNIVNSVKSGYKEQGAKPINNSRATSDDIGKFKLIDYKLKYPMINVHFKENRNGKLSIIGINAKKARGNMVNVIASNLIDSPEQLKNFSYLDYKYSAKGSSNYDLVFVK